MQKLRPDVRMHVALENVGRMRPQLLDAILAALGGLTQEAHVMNIDIVDRMKQIEINRYTACTLKDMIMAASLLAAIRYQLQKVII